MAIANSATISLNGMSTTPILEWDDVARPGYTLAVFVSDEHGFAFGEITPEGTFVQDCVSESWKDIRYTFEVSKAYRQREIFGLNQLDYLVGRL